MSGYQIFHEGGCSVCCRTTICNLFHCFYCKAVKIFLNKQKIRYRNTFQFDWLAMWNEVENVHGCDVKWYQTNIKKHSKKKKGWPKSQKIIKIFHSFSEISTLKRLTERFKSSLLLRAPIPVQNKISIFLNFVWKNSFTSLF